MPPPLRRHFPLAPARSPPQWCLVPRTNFSVWMMGGSEGVKAARDLWAVALWHLEVDLVMMAVGMGEVAMWMVEWIEEMYKRCHRERVYESQYG